jgi:hypothetical protein
LEIDVEIPHLIAAVPTPLGRNSRHATERAEKIAMAMTNYERQWLARVLRTLLTSVFMRIKEKVAGA